MYGHAARLDQYRIVGAKRPNLFTPQSVRIPNVLHSPRPSLGKTTVRDSPMSPQDSGGHLVQMNDPTVLRKDLHTVGAKLSHCPNVLCAPSRICFTPRSVSSPPRSGALELHSTVLNF